MFLRRWDGRVLLLLVMSGCSSMPDHLAGHGKAQDLEPTEEPCPPEIAAQVKVSASAVSWPETRSKEDPAATVSSSSSNLHLGRSVLIAVSPGEGTAGLALLSNRLTVTTVGGTLAGISPRVRQISDPRAIDVIPGRLQISPFITGTKLRPQTVSMELLVTPGGVPFDEMVVSTAAMWDSQSHPLASSQAAIALAPIRHLTMYDQVEGAVTLQLVVGRARERWTCSAETRFTLVDRAATSPDLWDLREAASGRRDFWLALSSPKTGPFRAVFASPADATSFANWLRQTHAVRVADYEVGVFRPGYSRESLRTLPEPHSVVETFRAASADDLDSLAVGRLGEP